MANYNETHKIMIKYTKLDSLTNQIIMYQYWGIQEFSLITILNLKF